MAHTWAGLKELSDDELIAEHGPRPFMARMMDAGFKIADSINKALEDDGE